MWTEVLLEGCKYGKWVSSAGRPAEDTHKQMDWAEEYYEKLRMEEIEKRLYGL